MNIDGAIGAAVVDYENGMTLGTIGGRSLDMELAGAGNTEVVRSKKNIIHDNAAARQKSRLQGHVASLK